MIAAIALDEAIQLARSSGEIPELERQMLHAWVRSRLGDVDRHDPVAVGERLNVLGLEPNQALELAQKAESHSCIISW